EAQGILEGKIAQLESLLATARVISPSQIDTSKVSILTKVTITNLHTKKQLTYQLVSEKEANLKAQKISINSPIGQGLLGKTIGEEVEINIPAGILKFKIDNISI
ncbi:MAG: GreA/GreB family elongation factor, partial [Chitinophagaceae bacterium]